MPQKTSVLEKLAAVWGRSGSNSKKKNVYLKPLVLTGFLCGLSELMPQLPQGSFCPRKEEKDKPVRIPVSLLVSEERSPRP